MKILLFCLNVSLIFITQACEPNRDCTDPRCISSSISLKLKARLSDTASVFRVGDTLKMYLKIPDTLNTSEGAFYLKSIQKLELVIDYYANSAFGDSTKSPDLPPIIVSKGTNAQNNRIFRPSYDNKDLELLFVFPKKNKYAISISSQSARLEMTDKSGIKYLIMLNVGFDVKDGHKNLYLSWLPYNKTQAEENFKYLDTNGFGYFCFRVE